MSKSYKKAVTIGVAAFSAVALLTTGAAAFVLTNEATNKTEGNVSVGTVVDNGVKLSVSTQQATIVLDADTSDTSGRVQFSSEDGKTPNMNISIDGSLIPVDSDLSTSEVVSKYNLTFTFAVSSDNISVGDSSQAGNAFFKQYVSYKDNTATTEYLTLKYTDQKAGEPSATVCPVDTATTITVAADGSFALDIDFNWGSFFENKNPSEYYDEEGSATSLDSVKSALDTLYDMNGLKFTVTLKAALKA